MSTDTTFACLPHYPRELAAVIDVPQGQGAHVEASFGFMATLGPPWLT